MRNTVNLIRTSDHPLARMVRGIYHGVNRFSVPVPATVLRPVVLAVVSANRSFQWLLRVFLCEPYLKVRCRRYGTGIRTGCFFHYILGNGHIDLGDRVQMDGKSSLLFASVLPSTPVLTIGDDSYVNHAVTFVVADRITIGRHVLIGPRVTLFDSPGHPLNPERRITGAPPAPEDIRPIVIEDNVWICTGATIFPGVTIGAGSVVALGAVVTKSVPPRSLVAGSPARVVRTL